MATPATLRPSRLRLRGSPDSVPVEPVRLGADSFVTAPPDGRATPVDEEPFDDEEPLRGTAVPTRDPSGGGVREGGAECTGGGGGGGALSVDPLELGLPELEDPELLDPLDPELDDPEEVDPRGTAWAHANAGTASANVKRRQST